MDYRILGPVEVWEDGRPVPLGGGKQRAVLAFLLLNANRVVSSDRLIDQLWDGQPPATAATALHGHVSGLRKALGPGVIATRRPGYVLEIEPEQIDLRRFERLRDEARSALERGDPSGQRGDVARGAGALPRRGAGRHRLRAVDPSRGRSPGGPAPGRSGRQDRCRSRRWTQRRAG